MEFPRLVFQANPDGKTTKHELVRSEDEHAAALDAGWFGTVPEALAPAAAPASAPAADAAASVAAAAAAAAAANEDTRPPTREEIEAKARELGLSFQPNIGSKKLLQRIEIALAGRQ